MMIFRVILIYALCLGAILGSIASSTFFLVGSVGIACYLIGRWQAVDSPSRIDVIGRDVRVPVIPKAVGRFIRRRIWWFW